MHLNKKFRTYTREDIEGKELVNIRFNLSSWTEDIKTTTDVEPVQVTLVTDKSIKVIGGGYQQRSYKDLGVLNYGIYVLREDAEAVIKEYWERLREVKKYELEKTVKQLKAIQQHLGLVEATAK